MHLKPQKTKGRSNGATAAEAPKEALPTHVEKEDSLALQLANEKVLKLQAQQQLLATQHAQVTAEFNAAQAEAAKVTAGVWEKYQLGPQDTFQNVSGLIERKPAEPAPEAKA